jgi:hypothetical protein
MIKAVKAIVHRGVSAQEAFEMYRESRKSPSTSKQDVDESMEKV